MRLVDTSEERLVLAALVDHEMTLVELANATSLRYQRLIPALDELTRRRKVRSYRDHPEPTLYALTDAR